MAKASGSTAKSSTRSSWDVCVLSKLGDLLKTRVQLDDDAEVLVLLENLGHKVGDELQVRQEHFDQLLVGMPFMILVN